MAKSKTNTTPDVIKTSEIREKLKRYVCSEIEMLPDTIDALPPDKKIESILKLLPYVLPKVEDVSMTSGENWWE
jgi:hypothetical protein